MWPDISPNFPLRSMEPLTSNGACVQLLQLVFTVGLLGRRRQNLFLDRA
jgi:hypothetical protein